MNAGRWEVVAFHLTVLQGAAFTVGLHAKSGMWPGAFGYAFIVSFAAWSLVRVSVDTSPDV